MTLSYWGALTESAFEVELRSMQTHSINTQAISDSEYTAVEDGALITTLNLQLTQQSLEEQTIRITSGPMYDDFEQVLNDRGDTYTIGLMHNSETYSNYDSPNSAPYVDAISGTIEIYYTIDSITLLNQRRNDPGSNLGGNLSLDHLAQADLDYLNITSGDTVFIFKNQEYTVWTHDQWLEDNGTDVLHHDWNGNESDYTLEKANFSMPENINTLAANFDDPVTLPFTAPGGNLEIQDPWLSQNETDFTEITGSTHQVFLDQNENFYDNIPIYRLQAPDVTQYDNTDWYFMQWSGSHVTFQNSTDNITPVVFTDAGAEVTADYKGHLRSEYSQPSNYNNTATLTYSNGSYRYLYRDFGRLFSTASFDLASTWQPENSLLSSIGSDDGVSLIYAGNDKYITAYE